MINVIIFAAGPSLSDIGAVVTALGVLAVLAVNVKELFWPSKSFKQEYVQQQSLSDLKDELTSDMDNLRKSCEIRVSDFKSNISATFATLVSKAELQKTESKLESLSSNHKELFDYTHKTVYEMLDKVNSIALRIETLHRAIDKEMSTDRERILEKIDETSRQHLTSIERLSNKVNGIELQMASLLVPRDAGRRPGNNNNSKEA